MDMGSVSINLSRGRLGDEAYGRSKSSPNQSIQLKSIAILQCMFPIVDVNDVPLIKRLFWATALERLTREGCEIFMLDFCLWPKRSTYF